MNLDDVFLSELSQPQLNKSCMIPRIGNTWISDICSQKGECWVSRVAGMGTWNLLLNGPWVSVQGDEEVLEMDGGDGSMTVWAYVLLINCMHYMDKMGGMGHKK